MNAVAESLPVTEMPAPKLAVAPGWKFNPLMVTMRLCPGAPTEGEREVRIGSSSVPRLTVTVSVAPPELAVTVAEGSLRSVSRSVA